MQTPSEPRAPCDCTGDTTVKPALGARYHFTEEVVPEPSLKRQRSHQQTEEEIPSRKKVRAGLKA